jgi:glycosyltransferase involved in cell wall biosynthesis
MTANAASEGRPRRRISIATPCRNAAAHIEETVRSVLANTALRDPSVQLQYLVCDGASTDGTVAIVERLFEQARAPNLDLHLISEPDSGMYEALARGLSRMDGDIRAYLNAGDYYSPTAFEVVLDLFQRPGVDWLTGLQVRYNRHSHLVAANLPYRYRRRHFETGEYGRWLPFLQQESTFWDASLQRVIDLDRLASFRLAGDYYLWRRFAEHAPLHVVEAWLGGFKVHDGQLSLDRAGYRAEVATMTRRPGLADRLLAGCDAVAWHSPNWLKRRLNRDSLFSYDLARQEYRLDVHR